MTLAAADRKSASTGCKAAKIAGFPSYFRKNSCRFLEKPAAKMFTGRNLLKACAKIITREMRYLSRVKFTPVKFASIGSESRRR